MAPTMFLRGLSRPFVQLAAARSAGSSFHVRHASSLSTPNVGVEVLDDGIAIVKFDLKGSKVNTLNLTLANEFETVMNGLENDPAVKAAVITSGKDNDFIAGADINMFVEAKTPEDLEKISRTSNEMFQAMANGKPKVAAINGTCLGGGLEFALACDYRVATTNSKTKLGLPEVMLGILPAAGGTQRLPALIGLQHALPLILTGKVLNATKAKKLKIVDDVVDPSNLQHAALMAARGLADGSLKIDREPKGYVARATKHILENTEFGRNFVFKKAREGVMKQTLGNYPAPLKIIDVLQTSAENGFGSKAGFEAEIKGFTELGLTPESRACVSIFFGKQKCEKNPFDAPKTPVKTVGVIGAGLMGAGITQVTVTKGFNVVLKDAAEEGLARGMDYVYKNLNTKVKRRGMTSFERDVTMSKINGIAGEDPAAAAALKNTDLIIEAVFEEIGLKHKVIKEIESMTPDHCVFATNTSAIPIADLAKASKRPDKFLGMHYFSPVEKMPLLEIIRHEGTSDEAVAAAYAVGLKQGKTIITVKDVPGFFVNRCLAPYSDEAVFLLNDGATIPQIDKVMKQYGFPVGPMTLVDEVGMVVATKVAKYLKTVIPERIVADSKLFDTVIDMGMTGRAAGKGMYLYPSGKSSGPKEVNPEIVRIIEENRTGTPRELSAEEIQMRMVTRFVNEAALCLQDEIIADPTTGDIGSIFGIGFPPFRGGPFRLLDTYGVKEFVDVMLKYQEAHGAHFTPAPILVDYAKSGKKFHSS